MTTKGGKCGCSSSILSFRNYNHEKRCTKGGEVLSCISFHLSVPAAAFAPRRPQRLTASFGGAKSSHKAAAKIALLPARRPPTLLPAARKGLRLRLGEQKVHRGRRRKTPYRRLVSRGLCSPPPAKAYGFVPGSKKFTQSGGENRFIAGVPAADFAPRRPQRHTASYRGAKSSHKARRKSSYCRQRGRRLCSPPPAKAYGFVSGSKIFTQGGGGNCLITGSPAADFAPRRPQRLTASFRGAKSSQRAAAEIALLPARRPRTLLPAARKGLRLRSGAQNLHTRRRRKTLYCRRESHSFGAGKRGGSKK